MMKIKLKNLIIPTLTIITLVFGIFCINNLKTVHADEIGIQDANILRSTFGKMMIENSNQTYNVTKEMAIQSANSFTGVDKLARSVHAQFAIMTNEDILAAAIPQKTKNNNPQINEKGYLYRVPVWIVSYEGLNMHRKNNITLTESNVVIDAITGEEIYGYNYR